MSNKIVIYAMKPVTTRELILGAYTYTGNNWFTNFLWWLLFKFDALQPYFSVREEVKRVEINADSVGAAVAEYLRVTAPGLYPKAVYLGPEEFENHIFGDYNHDYPVDFDVQLKQQDYRVLNIPVKVVPHMSGVLVV